MLYLLAFLAGALVLAAGIKMSFRMRQGREPMVLPDLLPRDDPERDYIPEENHWAHRLREED